MDIEKLAREAGFTRLRDGLRDDGEPSDYWDCWPEQLERFAALVVEECARVCEEMRAHESAAAAHHAGSFHAAFEHHTKRHAVFCEARDAIRSLITQKR